ncbi:DUF1289 domain-containing protein [Proteus mirabilis]|uniref:DUF1289 domain-containing protein n=1 Tax=Proteus mirabilis TaxID=584 RepID=UPI00107409FA|nr:DUF1289 domain-containing protein [Proteus mirabilis]TFT37564.1 DUF1289 domain-containing protein [Proteus mirabilis]
MQEQLEFFDIPSPCIGRCESNLQGYCIGCYRSRQERFSWSTMSQQEKRNVLRLCRQRYLGGNKKQWGEQEKGMDRVIFF